jgi:hypothetical protein
MMVAGVQGQVLQLVVTTGLPVMVMWSTSHCLAVVVGQGTPNRSYTRLWATQGRSLNLALHVVDGVAIVVLRVLAAGRAMLVALSARSRLPDARVCMMHGHPQYCEQ